jgi:hypothetical protein
MSMESATTCIQVSAILVGVGAAVTWIDFASLLRWSANGSVDSLGLRRRLGWSAGIGIVAALMAIVAGATSTAQFIPLALLAFLAVHVVRTTGFGLEGSDEMAIIILIPLAVASLPGAPDSFVRLALLFVAAQLLLAYLASAGAKAVGRKWREGSAVAQILSTQDYGLGRRDLFSSGSALFRWMSWGTIAFEFALPLSLLLGGPLIPLAVLAGVAFHATIGMTMGLNRFFPWFIAAYPAAIWASSHYGLLAS